MTLVLNGKIKDIAAVFGSVAVIWSVVSAIVAFVAIDPVIAWADKRYVGQEAFSKYVSQTQARTACQYAETQLDQVTRIMDRFDQKTDKAIVKDYASQRDKHKSRYEAWNCISVLDSIPIVKQSK